MTRTLASFLRRLSRASAHWADVVDPTLERRTVERRDFWMFVPRVGWIFNEREVMTFWDRKDGC